MTDVAAAPNGDAAPVLQRSNSKRMSKKEAALKRMQELQAAAAAAQAEMEKLMAMEEDGEEEVEVEEEEEEEDEFEFPPTQFHDKELHQMEKRASAVGMDINTMQALLEEQIAKKKEEDRNAHPGLMRGGNIGDKVDEMSLPLDYVPVKIERRLEGLPPGCVIVFGNDDPAWPKLGVMMSDDGRVAPVYMGDASVLKASSIEVCVLLSGVDNTYLACDASGGLHLFSVGTAVGKGGLEFACTHVASGQLPVDNSSASIESMQTFKHPENFQQLIFWAENSDAGTITRLAAFDPATCTVSTENIVQGAMLPVVGEEGWRVNSDMFCTLTVGNEDVAQAFFISTYDAQEMGQVLDVTGDQISTVNKKILKSAICRTDFPGGKTTVLAAFEGTKMEGITVVGDKLLVVSNDEGLGSLMCLLDTKEPVHTTVDMLDMAAGTAIATGVPRGRWGSSGVAPPCALTSTTVKKIPNQRLDDKQKLISTVELAHRMVGAHKASEVTTSNMTKDVAAASIDKEIPAPTRMDAIAVMIAVAKSQGPDEAVQMVGEGGAGIQALMGMMDSPDVFTKAAELMAAVACQETRDSLLQSVAALRPALRPADWPAGTDKAAAGRARAGAVHALLTVLKLFPSDDPRPELGPVNSLIPELSEGLGLTEEDDEDVVEDCLWCLAFLAEPENEEQIHKVLEHGASDKLVELLDHESDAIESAAMRCVGNVFTGHDHMVEHMIDVGVLPVLKDMMEHHHDHLRVEAAWATSNIAASGKDHVTAIIRSGLIHSLVDLTMDYDDAVKEEAAFGLSNATKDRDPNHVAFLVSEHVVEALIDFAQHDITEHPELAKVGLEGLVNIMAVGHQHQKEHRLKENPYTFHFVHPSDNITGVRFTWLREIKDSPEAAQLLEYLEYSNPHYNAGPEGFEGEELRVALALDDDVDPAKYVKPPITTLSGFRQNTVFGLAIETWVGDIIVAQGVRSINASLMEMAVSRALTFRAISKAETEARMAAQAAAKAAAEKKAAIEERARLEKDQAERERLEAEQRAKEEEERTRKEREAAQAEEKYYPLDLSDAVSMTGVENKACPLWPGAKIWLSKDFTFDRIPTWMEGALLFQHEYFVPNETVITLKMDTPVTVYVAVSSLRHGGLTESMPAQGWETMGGQSLGWAGYGISGRLNCLYKKVQAEAGNITLPATTTHQTLVSVVITSA